MGLGARSCGHRKAHRGVGCTGLRTRQLAMVVGARGCGQGSSLWCWVHKAAGKAAVADSAGLTGMAAVRAKAGGGAGGDAPKGKSKGKAKGKGKGKNAAPAVVEEDEDFEPQHPEQ